MGRATGAPKEPPSPCDSAASRGRQLWAGRLRPAPGPGWGERRGHAAHPRDKVAATVPAPEQSSPAPAGRAAERGFASPPAAERWTPVTETRQHRPKAPGATAGSRARTSVLPWPERGKSSPPGLLGSPTTTISTSSLPGRSHLEAVPAVPTGLAPRHPASGGCSGMFTLLS